MADDRNQNAVKMVATPVQGVAAELWLAATVLIAGCTVIGLGALSYLY